MIGQAMGALGRRWTNYWFRPAPLLDLAIVRLFAVSLQMALLTFDPRYSLDSLEAVAQLPSSFYWPLPALQLMLLPFGSPTLTLDTMYAVQVLTMCAGLLALVGLLTNASLLLFALGCTFIQAWTNSFGDIHHTEAAMMVSLGVLAFGPSGRLLSIDAWLRQRFGRSPPLDPLTASSAEARWPILVIQWFFALMYLSAFYAKLVMGNLQWTNGITLQYHLAVDGIRWGSDLGLFLSHYYWLVLLSSWAVFIFQGTFFISLLYPRLKILYVPMGMALHVGIYVLMRAPFFQWAVLYAVFVPWSSLIQKLRAARPAATRAPGLAAE
jgi:hypothetical protein